MRKADGPSNTTRTTSNTTTTAHQADVAFLLRSIVGFIVTFGLWVAARRVNTGKGFRGDAEDDGGGGGRKGGREEPNDMFVGAHVLGKSPVNQARKVLGVNH